MQMYVAYAIIPVFGGETRRLYRESRIEYVVRNKDSPKNHPIYIAKDNMGCFILAIDEAYHAKFKEENVALKEEICNEIWKLYFDGVDSKLEGACIGIVLIPSEGDIISLSYKLKFDTTNSVVEYEAPILDLEV